ncbi:MAG: hypothetical protein QOI91_131 [Solirubrobacteraceae bacterium]|nr:hypothetical protein [Solirubrobacteraceae bacterium]
MPAAPAALELHARLRTDLPAFLRSVAGTSELAMGRLACIRCGRPLALDSIGAVGALAPPRPGLRRRVRFACRSEVCVWHLTAGTNRSPRPSTCLPRSTRRRRRPALAGSLVALPGLDVDRLVDALGGPGLIALLVAASVAARLLLQPVRDTLGAVLAEGARHRAQREAREGEEERLAGEVESAVKTAFADAPTYLLEPTGGVEVLLDEGDRRAWWEGSSLVVVVEPAEDPDETIGNLLVGYLQRTLLVDARPHMPESVMCAADLRLARGMMAARPGVRDGGHALHARVEAACAGDAELHRRWRQVDALDVHGWLVRILLPEYKRVGDALGAGAVRAASSVAAERFLNWLHELARRRPGDRSVPLNHVDGADFRVGIVFVGDARYIARRGLRPHLERAVWKMYDDKVDALYLIARGAAVELARDGVFADLALCDRVVDAEPYEFRLRSDFSKRTNLRRSRAFVGRIELRPWEAHERPLSSEEEGSTLQYLSMRRQRVADWTAPRRRRDHS